MAARWPTGAAAVSADRAMLDDTAPEQRRRAGLWQDPAGRTGCGRRSPSACGHRGCRQDPVPEEYRSAFRHYGDGTRNSCGRTPIDLTVLPDGLRKEITWCMFRIADLGGVIGMSGAGTVVRMLGAAVAGENGPAVSSQVSLLDAGVQEWCQRIRAVFYRDSGRFPSPSTMRCVAYEIQRYSRALGGGLRHPGLVAAGGVAAGRRPAASRSGTMNREDASRSASPDSPHPGCGQACSGSGRASLKPARWPGPRYCSGSAR